MDGDVRVFESGAIMLYLVQKHPDAGLYSEVGLQVLWVVAQLPLLRVATPAMNPIQASIQASCPAHVYAAVLALRTTPLCSVRWRTAMHGAQLLRPARCRTPRSRQRSCRG